MTNRRYRPPVDEEPGIQINVKVDYVEIEVHDGRIGRDPAKVEADGCGELLATYKRMAPVEIGDRLRLPTGEVVPVIGIKDRWQRGVRVLYQRVSIGNAL